MRQLILPLCLALAACTHGDLSSSMSEMQGAQLDTVIDEWGPPDECAERDGRNLCVWRDLTAASAVFCTRTLEVDSGGVVIGWRWRGDRCEAAGLPSGSSSGSLLSEAKPEPRPAS